MDIGSLKFSRPWASENKEGLMLLCFVRLEPLSFGETRGFRSVGASGFISCGGSYTTGCLALFTNGLKLLLILASLDLGKVVALINFVLSLCFTELWLL